MQHFMKTHTSRIAAAFCVMLIVAGTLRAVAVADVCALKLPSPPSESERAYLGISGETFELSRLQADIIIIELFSLYCALCAREAPAVAELYALTQKHATPQCKIVMLGIGAGSSTDEVARFKKQHSVPFPLVPDQQMAVARALKMTITPGFIALKKKADGAFKVLHTRSGVLGPPQRFLESALKAAAVLP
jgi:hypothetical protein